MKRASSPVVVLALVGAIVLAGWATLAAQEQKPAKFPVSAIQIMKVESDEVKLPPPFQMALYENLIAEVQKTGKFKHVYRDGDSGAGDVPDLAIMRCTVTGFKKGSARQRQVTTVSGATSIKVLVQIATRDGHMLVARDVEGKVRFFGENLRATYNFAKNVAGIVRENF